MGLWHLCIDRSTRRFGSPPLEAAARGLPVVASQVSPWPEVVGDAVLLTYLADAAALAEPLAVQGAEKILREDQPIILSEINSVALRRMTGCTPAVLISQRQEYGHDCHSLKNGRLGSKLVDLREPFVQSVVFLPRGRIGRQRRRQQMMSLRPNVQPATGKREDRLLAPGTNEERVQRLCSSLWVG